MSKYVISFEDNPWYQDDYVGYYKCSEIPWWSAKKSDIKKLTPLDTVIEEAYQRGLKDGNKPEHECKDCRYYGNDYVECPCNYCSHNWESKFEPKAHEIKVGDEVEACCGRAIVFGVFADFCRYWYPSESRCDRDNTENLKWTGRHFPQVAELFKAMKEGAE